MWAAIQFVEIQNSKIFKGVAARGVSEKTPAGRMGIRLKLNKEFEITG